MPGEFSKKDRRRIGRATLRVEQLPLATPDAGAMTNFPAPRNFQRVKVYDATTATVSGVDYVSARLQNWDVASGAFQDVFATDTVKVFLTVGTPSVGDEYWVIEIQPRKFSGVEWPVFAVVTSPGNTQMIRFTGGTPPFETDPGSTPSPHCYYYAQTQKLTYLGKSDVTPIWAVPWYAITPVAGTGGNPATVVKVDGTAGHLAIYAGFSYSPNSVGSRPVYWFDAFAAAFDGGCRVKSGITGFGVDLEG